MSRERLTPDEARRAALAAQGFGRPRRSSAPGRRAIVEEVRRLGAVQIDSVNVLARAHYLPLFSRLGHYDRAVLDAASGRAPRSLFEYWGHEAALLPVATQPLFRWRMQRARDDAWAGMVRVAREEPDLVREVATVVAEHGPVTAGAVELVVAHEAHGRAEHWGWNWSSVKRALEFLFWAGEVTSAGRDASFRRRYALPEAVFPRAVLAAPTPGAPEATRALVSIAARALGVACVADLADHFRLPQAATRTAIRELVSAGELVEVTVPGWPPAYARPDLRVPRAEPAASALLAPFDPLIWFRPRTQRLFGMRYRIEIYTPADKRVHGYYVLPFLHDGGLVARVDLKADRRARRLLVRAAHAQGATSPAAVGALAEQLRAMATWLDLDDVEVATAGDLSGVLRPALAARL